MRHSTVLFFDSHSGFFDGAQQSLYLLLTHLDRRRFRPLFVGPEEGPLTHQLTQAGVQTVIVPHDMRLGLYGGRVLRESVWGKGRLAFSYLAYTWAIRRLMEAEGVEMVHCNSIRSLLTVGLAARLVGVPLIWHLRLNLELGLWNHVGLKLADKVIVVSDSLREHFPAGPGEPAKFVTVYNGLDLREFASQADVSVVRQELGIPPGWQAVGMTGTITPRKNQLDLLRAAASVIQVCPQTKFVIVGEAQGPENNAYMEQLRAYVAAMQLEQHVIFTGWRSDVARVLPGLDLFVLPSLNEGLPRAILEAMALSLPVIATRVGGNPELMVHGQTGLLVPAQDLAALAAAMLKLLQHPEHARAMGDQGRQRVETSFSLQAATRGVEEVIEAVLTSRGRSVGGARRLQGTTGTQDRG